MNNLHNEKNLSSFIDKEQDIAKYYNAHIVLEDCLRFATDFRYIFSENMTDALGIAVEVLEEKLNKLKGETDGK